MNILVLGGTRFVGRHFVEAALKEGHGLTLFHRTHSDHFPEVEQVLGDRNEHFAGLEGRRWDAILDTCCYVPRQARSAFQALGGAATRYVLISTISVYAQPYPTGQTPEEDWPVIKLEDPTVEDVNGDTYGGLKVLCEREAAAWGDRLWAVRPGLIVGPHDHTGRFAHWVEKCATNAPFEGPPRLDQPVQVLDARDLASFLLLGLRQGHSGVVNATGARETFASVFEQAQTVWPECRPLPTASQEALEWPMVLPLDGSWDALMSLNQSRAKSLGLVNRPLADTMRDIAAWARSVGSCGG